METPDAIARRVLFAEARLLDTGAWIAWSAMFRPDAIFWVPAWRDEYDLVEDPRSEVSLIFHDSRRGLEERISRIESRKSITALPLPRTVHAISNIEAHAPDDATIATQAVFCVHVYDPRTAREQIRYGRYEHDLQRDGESWMIARKKIVLLNDQVSSVLDFYSI